MGKGRDSQVPGCFAMPSAHRLCKSRAAAWGVRGRLRAPRCWSTSTLWGPSAHGDLTVVLPADRTRCPNPIPSFACPGGFLLSPPCPSLMWSRDLLQRLMETPTFLHAPQSGELPNSYKPRLPSWGRPLGMPETGNHAEALPGPTHLSNGGNLEDLAPQAPWLVLLSPPVLSPSVPA